MVAKNAAREFNNKTKGKKSDKHLYFSMGGQTDKNIKCKTHYVYIKFSVFKSHNSNTNIYNSVLSQIL